MYKVWCFILCQNCTIHYTSLCCNEHNWTCLTSMKTTFCHCKNGEKKRLLWNVYAVEMVKHIYISIYLKYQFESSCFESSLKLLPFHFSQNHFMRSHLILAQSNIMDFLDDNSVCCITDQHGFMACSGLLE